MNRADELSADDESGLDGHPRDTRPSEPITFPPNEKPTLGVELEVSLVDLESQLLAPRAEEVLETVGDEVHFKPELFQTIVELNTDVCRTVADVRKDLTKRLKKLHKSCASLGLGCICVGTHPTADWRNLPITERERYENLVTLMHWPARRLLICGMHVHVGVESGEHAVALMNSINVFLPHLLALSASSPYWMGRDTGMASARSQIFECLPTAGLPPRIENWRQFVQLMRTLLTAGTIASIREIWWDVRPHPGFGTLEVRICDGVNTIDEACAIAALVQCLVVYLQELYDHGEPLPMLRNWTLKENKWRAARFGVDTNLIRNERGTQVPLREHIHEWLEDLQPFARRLGCAEELASVAQILERNASYARQRRFMKSSGSYNELVKALVSEFGSNEPLG